MSGINPFSFISTLGGQAVQAAIPFQHSQIIALPPALNSLPAPVQIKGDITAINQDSTVQINTAQGSLTVKIPTATSLPIGTTLDLQIPAGRDATTLLLRPVPVPLSPLQGSSLSPVSSDTIQTNTSSITQPQADVKSLQQTAIQARASVIENGLPQQQSLTLQQGQTIRLSPLPNALQSLSAIQGQFQNTETQQIQATLPERLNTSAPIPISNTQATIIDRPLIDMLLNIRQTLTPTSMNYQVSGDRTPLPIPTTLPSLPVSSSGNIITISTASPSSNASALPRDGQITTMIEPMHIRPPVITTATVSMSSSFATTQPNTPSSQLLTMLNGFAGEGLALATGYMTEDGNPIVQMMGMAVRAEFYSINYPARTLPAGTFIVLKPMAMHSPTQSLMGLQDPLPPLLQSLPPATAQAIMNAMPSPQNIIQFPVAALLFLAAATGGDLSGWLGGRQTRAIDTMPKTQLRDILQDLLSSGRGRAPTAADPQPVQSGEWRGHQIPLINHDGVLHQALLWVKDDDGQSSLQNAKDRATRFLLDLDLTRMGTVQFDGLIHTNKKTLDLSFISQRHLATAMEDRLRDIWYATLDGLGYSGSLNFKAKT